MHPISKYVSHYTLYNSFRVFTTNMSSMKIPKFRQDHLVLPKWRETVMEEMRVFEMNLGFGKFAKREDKNRM